jgi:hypothetical protein
MSLTLSFDIGYASIGWCVLSAPGKAPAPPEILGTGVVTFPTDDCLASRRRDLRRTRRHIRSTISLCLDSKTGEGTLEGGIIRGDVVLCLDSKT